MMQRAIVRCLLVVAAATAGLAAQSVRAVDSVAVGTAGDETSHHLAGSGTVTGASGGRAWRSATGWFSYTLHVYDDSPLTLVCVLADEADSLESSDIFVDGWKASTPTRTPSSKTVEFRVSLPFAATAGKTEVVVKFAARAGKSTARLVEVRTLQEHLE
jgi:hypothetical protein